MPGSMWPTGVVPLPDGYASLHFKTSEFARPARPGKGFPDPAPYPEAWLITRLRPLCEALEVIRAALGGRAMTIGSGYRDPAYNVRIKGALNSQHMAGRAADIVVAGVPASKVHDTVLKLYNEGKIKIGGLGRYPSFTHVDVRETKRLVRWSGSRADNG